jgi:hypothetical protein
MKVFAHYFYDNINDVEYRWRTIIQIGDSWDIRGTIFMKNPGSSKSVEPNIKPIKNGGLLEELRKFDDRRTSVSCEWYEFSVDRTMICVINLFKAYYEAHGEKLNGVIQIFNLFNVRDANLWKAIDKCKDDGLDKLIYTTDDDIKNIVSPVYIGWGNLWRVPAHKENAQRIFSEVIKKTSYLCNGIENNKFYHPQYLLNYGKNRKNCIDVLEKFIKLT